MFVRWCNAFFHYDAICFSQASPPPLSFLFTKAGILDKGTDDMDVQLETLQRTHKTSNVVVRRESSGYYSDKDETRRRNLNKLQASRRPLNQPSMEKSSQGLHKDQVLTDCGLEQLSDIKEELVHIRSKPLPPKKPDNGSLTPTPTRRFSVQTPTRSHQPLKPSITSPPIKNNGHPKTGNRISLGTLFHHNKAKQGHHYASSGTHAKLSKASREHDPSANKRTQFLQNRSHTGLSFFGSSRRRSIAVTDDAYSAALRSAKSQADLTMHDKKVDTLFEEPKTK